MEHEVGAALPRQRERLLGGRRFERLEPGGSSTSRASFVFALVVVDDEHEQRPASSMSRRGRSALCSPTTTTSCARARAACSNHPDDRVVAVCGDLDELLAAVDAELPDVVVTDIRMPPTGDRRGDSRGERLRDDASGNRRRRPQPVRRAALRAARCSRQGTAGRAYLLKERVDDLEQLAGAIRAVADGGSVVDPKVVEALVAANARAEQSPLAELTPRERTSCARWPRGRTTPRSRSRSSSPSVRSRR